MTEFPHRYLVERFVEESNKIEGILREPHATEIEEFYRFMALEKITIADLERFVMVYQPNARLRDKEGLNVRVGKHIAPRGGPEIRNQLRDILENKEKLDAYTQHIQYETLHPFTDGNGRSGRMLWAWAHRDISLGFLHMWYYQSFSNARKNT